MRFETDNAFHFDYFLAERLRMTVEELRQRMSAREWMEWGIYYGRKAQAQEMAMARARG